MLLRSAPGCSLVAAYLWQGMVGEQLVRHARVDALDYWPLHPGIEKIDGRNYIVVAEPYRGWPSPSHEQLENGETREMKRSRWAGGGVYFNRSRKALRDG